MRHLLTSVTRIADLAEDGFDVSPAPRDTWGTGDYVVGEVLDASGYHNVELPNGRLMEAMEGDRVVGAFGARAATLEAVGDWQSIEGELFEALTPAGLFGRLTSVSPFLPRLMGLRCNGLRAVLPSRASSKAVNGRFGVRDDPRCSLDVPNDK